MLRRDYLQVLHQLRSTIEDEPSRANTVQWWEILAEKVGIKEDDLRSEAEAESMQGAAVGMGCSWFKCPMFRREAVRATSVRCAGCQVSVYCGLLCQKRSVSTSFTIVSR